MIFAFHLRELNYRLGYSLFSFILSCTIFFIYLPQLFKFSPFFFLHSSWDEAFLSLLSISIIFSIIWTIPLLLLHIYSWLTPALLPREYNNLKYIILWINILIMIYIMVTPTLFWSLPSFLLTFQTNTILFTPTLTFLARLVWDFSISYNILILCAPISIYLSISRRTLYFVLILYSIVFQDIWSMMLMLLPLVIIYEITYFMYKWAKCWVHEEG